MGGTVAGSLSIVDAAHGQLSGSSDYQAVGTVVEAGGDLNDDGLGDILVGSSSEEMVYLGYGPITLPFPP